MARAAQDKAYRTFVGGFITEATGLTFPENSCRDVDNCDIELKGSIRRRLGLNEEAGGYLLGSGVLVDQVGYGNGGPEGNLPAFGETCTKEELAVTAHVWQHPGGRTDLNFVVFQVGNTLVVRNWDNEIVSDPAAIQAHVSGAIVFYVNGGPTGGANGFLYNVSNLGSAKVPLQSTSGFGRLWFTSAAVVPFYMEYDPTTKVIAMRPNGFDAADSTTTNGRLAIRDFNGVPDGLKVDDQPVTLTPQHRYNLRNQGWSTSTISAYFSGQTKYPANSQQWILGKDSNGDFDDALLAKQDFGNSPAPKGRGIMHALTGNRDTVVSEINLNNQYDERATASFSTCAFYAGRLWLSGDNNPKRPNGVYFTKTLSRVEDSGVLMQENDPTSEHFPDVMATDGGVIYITEASFIQKLMPFGAGLLVMASNGIWFIYGGEGGFTATNFSVEKVSSTGILGASTVAQTDQTVAFFAENSIHVVALPESGIIPAVMDIGQNKVFSYYGTIPRAARARAQGCFDNVSKKIFWSWLDLGAPEEYAYPQLQACYNRCLLMDTRTGAYTKYSFTSDEGDLFFNGVMFPKRTITRPKTLDGVVTLDDGQVMHTSQGEVVAFQNADSTDEFINSVKVVLIDGPRTGICLGEFYDTNFRDYRTMPSMGAQDYSSFLVTGDEILDDLQRNKQATYVHSFFQRTETGFEVSQGGELIAKNPSGCTLVGRWDWHNTAAGGRWTDPQVAYRYRRPYTPTGLGDPLDTGEEIVYTKLKIRGKGRALTLRYDSVSQKDFQLLGFSAAFTANGV